jgi:hypothetical protein
VGEKCERGPCLVCEAHLGKEPHGQGEGKREALQPDARSGGA